MFKIFGQLKWFFRQNKARYLIAFVVLVFTDFLALVIPWTVGFLSDHIDRGTLTRETLGWLSAFLITVVLVYYAANYYWSYAIFTGSDRLARDTRTRLMQKFLLQSPRFFTENSAGSLLSKTMNDSESVENIAGWGIMCLADATIYPVSILAFMIVTISWEMTLIALIPLLFIFPYYRKIGARLFDLYNDVQQSYEELYNQVLENIAGIRLTRAYRMEAEVEAQFNVAVQKTYEKTLSYNRYQAKIEPFNRFCSGASVVIALAAGAWFIESGRISLGQLMSFNIYLALLVWPMMALGEFINISQQASASMSRIQELLDYREEYKDQADALRYSGGGQFAFNRFSFKYPNSEIAALDDIHFEFKAGQTLGIVGRTGSGKTTLAKQFLHLYPLKGDALTLNNAPLWAYKLEDLRRQSAYVPQEHSLFSLSIRDNVRLAEEGLSDAAVDRAIELAELSRDLQQFPDGANTLVGERGITLSGGQKQRVAIARAFVMDADLLILDDSLSAVDSRTETRILEHIRRERRGRSTLITAHRLSAVMHADLILVLEQGRIVQRGTHEELLAMEGWYREQYLHQQMEGGPGDDDE